MSDGTIELEGGNIHVQVMANHSIRNPQIVVRFRHKNFDKAFFFPLDKAELLGSTLVSQARKMTSELVLRRGEIIGNV